MDRVSTDPRASSAASIIPTVWLTLLAFGMYAWGIKKNLPYVAEVDEQYYWVSRAITMADSGNLNPGWFGHPGSTILYPLAALYRLLYGTHAAQSFAANAGPFFLLGRLLSISYATVSISILYRLGLRLFSHPVALLGSLLFLSYSLVVAHAQVVRSDSAAVCFSLLALSAMVRLAEQPTLRRHLAVGFWIGLSIASRYFMVVLCGLFLAISLTLLRRDPQKRTLLRRGLVTFGMVAITFCFTTPYVVLDFPTALRSIRDEARPTHLGADGFSWAGNLWWYLAIALPGAVGWGQYPWVIFGASRLLRHHGVLIRLAVGYLAAFVVGISLSPLHWQRWLIPILPIVALVAAAGLWQAIVWVRHQRRSRPQLVVLVGLAAALAVLPTTTTTILANIRDSRASTRVVTREWVLNHLPDGSRVVQEWYGAPLDHTTFRVNEQYALGQMDPRDVLDGPYDYAVVSSTMYDRFFAEPDVYALEVAFYTDLFRTKPLLFEAQPGAFRGGGVIRVYQLH